MCSMYCSYMYMYILSWCIYMYIHVNGHGHVIYTCTVCVTQKDEASRLLAGLRYKSKERIEDAVR